MLPIPSAQPRDPPNFRRRDVFTLCDFRGIGYSVRVIHSAVHLVHLPSDTTSTHERDLPYMACQTKVRNSLLVISLSSPSVLRTGLVTLPSRRPVRQTTSSLMTQRMKMHFQLVSLPHGCGPQPCCQGSSSYAGDSPTARQTPVPFAFAFWQR